MKKLLLAVLLASAAGSALATPASDHRINVEARDAALTDLYRAMHVTHVTARDRSQMIKAGEAATAQATSDRECPTVSRIAAEALVSGNPTLDGEATREFFYQSCLTRLSRAAL